MKYVRKDIPIIIILRHTYAYVQFYGNVLSMASNQNYVSDAVLWWKLAILYEVTV